jgi:hypothetical protein
MLNHLGLRGALRRGKRWERKLCGWCAFRSTMCSDHTPALTQRASSSSSKLFVRACHRPAATCRNCLAGTVAVKQSCKLAGRVGRQAGARRHKAQNSLPGRLTPSPAALIWCPMESSQRPGAVRHHRAPTHLLIFCV